MDCQPASSSAIALQPLGRPCGMMLASMNSGLRPRRAATPRLAIILAFSLCAAFASGRDKKPAPVAPKAGPRATPLGITWLYIQPDTGSQKVAQVQIGREMVILEKSGPWFNVEANTDVQEEQDDQDTPEMGDDNSTPQTLTGWMQAKGIVQDSTPDGDHILMGAAA